MFQRLRARDSRGMTSLNNESNFRIINMIFTGSGILLYTWSATKQVSFSQYSDCKRWSCDTQLASAQL